LLLKYQIPISNRSRRRGLGQNMRLELNLMESEGKLPNIAVVLKQEVSRLARKEVRTQTQKLQKAVVQYRSDIAALKRHASTLKAQLAALERRTLKNVPSEVIEPAAKGIRFAAKGVHSHRTLLGISAADYGLLVGVTGHTIYKWEHGAARPRQAQLAGLASIRGLRKKEALARLEQLRHKAAGTRKKKR
jgi:DNA-binding transcriptional regulator YiaG